MNVMVSTFCVAGLVPPEKDHTPRSHLIVISTEELVAKR